MYKFLYLTHITCVCLSISGFTLRGILLLREHPIIRQRWIKIAPHIIDTLLLVSAISLTLQIEQYPLQNGWLTAKVLALLAYIGFGIAMFRTTNHFQTRLFYYLLALICAAYIVLVALTKSVTLGLF